MKWYPRLELQGPCFALSIEGYEWSGGDGGRGGGGATPTVPFIQEYELRLSYAALGNTRRHFCAI